MVKYVRFLWCSGAPAERRSIRHAGAQSARTRRVAAAVAAVVVSVASPRADEARPLPVDFVYLRLLDPGIRQEIRYAGGDNFVGEKLPGYQSAECILRKAAAEALKAVEADLGAHQLGLKVFDCYRPKRAVAAMAAWISDGNPAAATRRYFPTLDKADLHSLGYIARKSAHSTGYAVDLTLVRRDAASAPASQAGSCTGPSALRSAPDEIDMGTGFDCLDPLSHTASGGVTREQHAARMLLVAAMRKRGFTNYAREWWHFTFAGGTRSEAYDFPILPLGSP